MDNEERRSFYGRNGYLERLLEDLHWEMATEEAIKNQKKPAYYARPPAKEDIQENENKTA